MANIDPISDGTPYKRRKVDHNDNGKAWECEDDNSDNVSLEDFENAADTLLWSQRQKPQLSSSYKTRAPQSGTINSSPSTMPRLYTSQPTQPTQRLLDPHSPINTSDVLVDRSSPFRSPPRQFPQPIKRAAFAKPAVGGILASAMAPPGTTFRKPLGVQRAPPRASQTIDVSSDEDDPPVDHGSDTEAPNATPNLKPTEFKKGGRGWDSTSAPIVKESPRAASGRSSDFSSILREFQYSSTSPVPKGDGGGSIAPHQTSVWRSRPSTAKKQTRPTRAEQVAQHLVYKTIDDIDSVVLRRKVKSILETCPQERVDRCMTALELKKGNVGDAVEWLLQERENDARCDDGDSVDDLGSTTPAPKRGVAISTRLENVQVVRSMARQDIKAPSQTIAEKYRAKQPAWNMSKQIVIDDEDEDEEEVKPRRRLLKSRPKARLPSPSPPPTVQKLPQLLQRIGTQVVVVEDDSESDSGLGRSSVEAPNVVSETKSDARLLRFFNDCSVKDLADLSAQPVEICSIILDERPFQSLNDVRAVTSASHPKAGKKTNKVRAIGDKMVDVCSETWSGYDAIDELVDQCERIAKPIQEALKAWGVSGGGDGELQLMNLDAAHDSAIGTPASSCTSDEVSVGRTAGITPKPKAKRFIDQPESMSPDVTLKDYQLVGLNWLRLLWSSKISCILADDMGLGKTCQVIAFLVYLQELGVDGVHLIIVPGSTLENWLREFKHFAPLLTVVPYYGSQQERVGLRMQIEDDLASIDVVVTTYDMAVKRDDNHFLRTRVAPLVCVYDEAQALRNSQSDRYRQLVRIPAEFRVLLTGTPLQNNLKELIAILAFIMPDLFREKQDELQYIFKHKATTKDSDHAALLSAQRIARARSMMTPFILRRKKQQVLDLPKKHSRIEYCDMTQSQAEYYERMMEEAQLYFASKHNVKAKVASSNILMSLRKAAIHPLLARDKYDDNKIGKIVSELMKHEEFRDNRPEEVRKYLMGDHPQALRGGDYRLHVFCSERPYLKKYTLKKEPWMDSGKVHSFRKLVTAFVQNGDRVLVFSQFTSMMDILEAVLETLSIKFMRLDGSTSMQIRQEMIDQFYSDEDIMIFMLSTRAGGAGINLACANKVIIFDSGYNPQDEVQAENRAHRVGQTREVEVVRLVTRSTIEEQIHALGESKLALDERVAGEVESRGEGKQAEQVGEQAVEKMFLDSLKARDRLVKESDQPAQDLKEAFKIGLESAGVKVASKQAVL